MTRFRMTEVADVIQEGDRIRFALTDGEEVEAFAVQVEEDGTALFIFTDCLQTEYRMHPDWKYPGWEKSELRGKLNSEILERFPDEIRVHMTPFENGDMLRIPTAREVFGDDPYDGKEPKSVQQFPLMKDRRNRIAFRGYGSGEWEWYWLQNSTRAAGRAADVYSGGLASSYGAGDSRGVRPLFRYR